MSNTKRGAVPLVTARMSPLSLRLIRLIAADAGERQYAVLDRLLIREALARELPVKDK